MKKHIAFMVSCIMLAVCFCFPGYALEYYAYTDSVSYDYGDVSLSAQLSGVPSNMDGSNDESGWDIEYTFSVTLINKTSDFQVANSNLFRFYFNSGYNDYFTKTMFTNTFELVDSSDNASNIKWTTSVSYLSFSFTDSELLVLNPNETRTYTFVLKQHFPFNVNIAWYGNTIVASSLTYNSRSSITINSKPSTFNSNTVDDFIDNNSFPNTSIAWLMAAYEQGIVDHQKYDQIIELLTYGSVPTISINGSGIYNFETYNFYTYSNTTILGYRVINPGHIYTRNVQVDSSLDGSYLHDDYYVVPVTYYVLTRSNKPYYTNSYYINFIFGVPFYGYKSFEIREVASDYFTAYNSGNVIFTLQGKVVTDNNNMVIPKGTTLSKIVVDYYFYVSDISNTDNYPSINVLEFSPSTYNLTDITPYNQSIFSSVSEGLGKIYDLLFGDSSQNNQISDDSGNVSDNQDQIHAQEQQWYSDNEAAIEATGLSNFEFSSGELDGLTQLRLQFSQVWGALGDWTLVYIFVLSLSLATFILRHRPTTKAQQRMTDSKIRAAESRRRSEA